MTMPDVKPATESYVFVSYASADRERARAIVDQLEAAGVRVWVDEESLTGGASWGRQVVQGIRGCTAQVVLVSAASVASRNVLQEIQLGWKYERPYLPLLLERTPLPEQVEYWLEGWQWVEVLDHPADAWLPPVRRALAALGLSTGSTPAPSGAVHPAPPATVAPAPPRSEPAPPTSPVARPETRYARSGELYVAYQVFGDGPIDFVLVQPSTAPQVEQGWEDPIYAAFLGEMASFCRVIVFDKRGTGLSDRITEADLPTLETRMDDVRAVMDAAGSERAVVLGLSEGGPMSILFAATYPERVHGLILFGTFAYPVVAQQTPPAERERQLQERARTRGTVAGAAETLKVFAPSIAAEQWAQAYWARQIRQTTTPGGWMALARLNWQIDVRPALPTIRVPTLVVHLTGDRVVSAARAHELAAAIPGARLVELPGEDHLFWYGDQRAAIVRTLREFIEGIEPQEPVERLLAAVLVVEAEVAAATAARYDELLTREVARHRGRLWQREGDRAVATFDGSARAVRCARAVVVGARTLGLAARAGLHIGECELRGEVAAGEVVRLAVAIAARAEPGEVLLSEALRGLAAAPGMTLAERGALAGGTGEGVRLFEVQ